jgi:hypothetical protein
MTSSQFPSLALMRVTADKSYVSAWASRPIAMRKGARNATNARVGYIASEKDASAAMLGGSAAIVAERAASCSEERIMKYLAERAGKAVSDGEGPAGSGARSSSSIGQLSRQAPRRRTSLKR